MNDLPILYTTLLSRSFPSGNETVQVLQDLSITIARRSLTMLKGRSGSGKTTLINLLGALDLPTSGTVHFDGREITLLPERQRDQLRRTHMGFVFQSVALISSMTAFENVDFGLRVAGYDARKRKARVEEVLEHVGLEKRMTHRTQELSGGEQQRVAIARANRPGLLLADEPTGSVDRRTAGMLYDLFRTLNREMGLTIVIVTHDRQLSRTVERVVAIRDGRTSSEFLMTRHYAELEDGRIVLKPQETEPTRAQGRDA